MTRILLVIIALAVSGCLDPARPQEPPSEGAEPPTTGTPEGEAPEAPPDSSYARDAVWTNCHGIATELRYVPGTLFGVEQNPHWEEHEDPYGVHDLALLECERISWGLFERPARFILESYFELNEPETCQRTNSTGSYALRMIASIWVDDPELAAYLQDEYGLPAYSADISVEMDESGALPVQVWRWGPPGQAASELQTPIDPLPRDARSPFDWRFFWFNDTAVSALDVHQEFDSPFWPDDVALDVHEVATRASHGKLEAPMLASNLPAYVTQGEYQTNVHWSGHITKYTDHECRGEVP